MTQGGLSCQASTSQKYHSVGRTEDEVALSDAEAAESGKALVARLEGADGPLMIMHAAYLHL